jgi:aminoglycoside 6'-N-acetyltransferase I
MKVREAALGDLEALSALRARLWPDAPLAEHRREARAILDGTFQSTMPLSLLVAEAEGRLIGFAEVGLRSHADGCDPSRPCGYLEGWYVEPEHRRRGVGRALQAAAEARCRERGCVEMASDTWLGRSTTAPSSPVSITGTSARPRRPPLESSSPGSRGRASRGGPWWTSPRVRESWPAA